MNRVLLFSMMFFVFYACTPRVQTAPGTTAPVKEKSSRQVPGITIDSVAYLVDTLQYFPAGPGSWFAEYAIRDNNLPLHVFVVKTNVQHPYVSLDLVMSHDSIAGLETTSSMARRKSEPGLNYFAGVNGDFYNTRGVVGHPVHGTASNGQLITRPNQAYHLVFNKNDRMAVDHLGWEAELRYKGSQVSFNSINDTLSKNQPRLLNAYWSKEFHNKAGELVWTLVPDIKGRYRIGIVDNKKRALTIPEAGYVVDFAGTAPANWRNARPGDAVTLNQKIRLKSKPAFNAQIVTGARNYILKDGKIFDKDWAERHPRTSWGTTRNGDTMIMAVVDGRSKSSVGVTTWQLAQIMKWLGATEAVNLDGGGSSTMYVLPKGVMNHPSDGRERAVANALFAVSSAPENNNVASIAANHFQVPVSKGDVVDIEVMGFNRYGNLAALDPAKIKLSAADDLGRFSGKTTFVASGKPGTIEIVYDNKLRTKIFLK